MPSLPEISPLELQVLRILARKDEASVRDLREDMPDPPTYSTIRKIVERLEEKGAIARVRLDGKAWIYRCAVAPSALVKREVRRLIDSLFDGAPGRLVAHLVDMDALTLKDVAEAERRLAKKGPKARRRQE